MPNQSLTQYPSDRPLHAAYGACKDIASFVGCTLRPPCAPPVENVPRGDGHTVLVFPGFLTGDWATKGLINWLRDAGYDARGWGRGLNWGPTPVALTRCAARLHTPPDPSIHANCATATPSNSITTAPRRAALLIAPEPSRGGMPLSPARLVCQAQIWY